MVLILSQRSNFFFEILAHSFFLITIIRKIYFKHYLCLKIPNVRYITKILSRLLLDNPPIRRFKIYVMVVVICSLQNQITLVDYNMGKEISGLPLCGVHLTWYDKIYLNLLIFIKRASAHSYLLNAHTQFHENR